MRRFLLPAALAFVLLFAPTAHAQQQQPQQRLDVCTPTGLTADANALTAPQKRELAVMCMNYFYGAFLCAPVKATLGAIAIYGKQYQLSEKDIDPTAFAAPGSWTAHIKANAATAEQIGQAKIQQRMNSWSQIVSAYFTKTVNEGKKLTGPILLAYIRGPEFAQVCSHVKP